MSDQASILHYYAGKFSIITFEEFISIALDAPRVVGIYPEIKNPVFINQHVSLFLLKIFHQEDRYYHICTWPVTHLHTVFDR